MGVIFRKCDRPFPLTVPRLKKGVGFSWTNWDPTDIGGAYAGRVKRDDHTSPLKQAYDRR